MRFGDRLRESSREHSSRIVLALDMAGDASTRAARGAELLGLLGPRLAGVKLNFHVLLPGGLGGVSPIVDVCARDRLPLIADIKLNDIESTNLETTRLLFEGGFDAVIANPFVGAKEGLSKVISEARRIEKGVLLLVYMSHAGADEGYGLRIGGEPLFETFARRVRDWDADGAIVSSKSPEVIRRVRSLLAPGQLILSPGVGFQGGEASEAIEAGTDFAIVGRSIVGDPDPLSTLERLNDSMPAPRP